MERNWEILFDWNVEIWFRIEKDGDGYPRSKSWEQLLAWPVLERDDYFSIESIPFFLKGISRGDIVRGKVTRNSEDLEGEFFEFDGVVDRGGHNTYRIHLRGKRPKTEVVKKELLEKGLALEIEHGDFFAIVVPPSVNQKEIDDYLVSGRRAGRWGLQDGYVSSVRTDSCND